MGNHCPCNKKDQNTDKDFIISDEENKLEVSNDDKFQEMLDQNAQQDSERLDRARNKQNPRKEDFSIESILANFKIERPDGKYLDQKHSIFSMINKRLENIGMIISESKMREMTSQKVLQVESELGISLQQFLTDIPSSYPNSYDYHRRDTNSGTESVHSKFERNAFHSMRSSLLQVDITESRFSPEVLFLKQVDPAYMSSRNVNGKFASEEDMKVFLQPPILFNSTNEIYHGQWNLNLLKHGVGQYIKANGTKYIGNWHLDRISGQGFIVDVLGNYYIGSFKEGQITGKGKMVIKSNSYEYNGHVLNGKPNGIGMEYFKDGSRYKGEFTDGLKNGKGLFIWADGSTYVGSFKQGRPDGKGVMNFKDGRKYTGEFKAGVLCGRGKFKWPDNKMYEGSFSNNSKNGAGKYIWDEYTFYEGFWLNGKQHGQGQYKSNANEYNGIWRQGRLIRKDWNSNNIEDNKNKEIIKSPQYLDCNPSSGLGINNHREEDFSLKKIYRVTSDNDKDFRSESNDYT